VKPKLKKSEAAVVEAVEVCLGGEEEVAVSLAEIGARAACSWNTVLRRVEEQKVVEELQRRGIEITGPDRKSEKGMLRVSRS
jgi:hypothetical protein